MTDSIAIRIVDAIVTRLQAIRTAGGYKTEAGKYVYEDRASVYSEASKFPCILVYDLDETPVIITSNRSFEEWPEVFNNDLLASAALDRLTHHAHPITIRSDSFRQRNRPQAIVSTPGA